VTDADRGDSRRWRYVHFRSDANGDSVLGVAELFRFSGEELVWVVLGKGAQPRHWC
jgi:hypothetical protein